MLTGKSRDNVEQRRGGDMMNLDAAISTLPRTAYSPRSCINSGLNAEDLSLKNSLFESDRFIGHITIKQGC